MVTMRYLAFIICVCIYANGYTQSTPLPHGMVFGKKPDTSIVINATQVHAYMGKKPRISTTLKGTVVKVTKEKGGWFTMDAGEGKVIAATFTDFNVTLPSALRGRTVIVEGVAARQFVPGNRQRLSGDTTAVNAGPVKTGDIVLRFEATGLLVYK